MIARMEKIDSPKSVYTVKMGNRAKQSNSGETSIFHMEPFLNSLGSNSIKIDLSQSVLSETGKTELLNILNRNIKAFGEGGCYNGPITHRIDLIPGTPPIASRAYRAPIAVKEEMKKQINTMLEQGIIEPSTSAFSAPVVMVPKKDATLRFAIDFRRLNAATIKTVYHLPLIPEILDEVGGKHIFSTFDFAAGFHQIPMHERHKERTAFSCYLGLFQFLKMPMGLSGAPLTFQRVMNNLKQYISASFLIYLDDVILASEDEESHLKDINQFLEVVQGFGMKLKLIKCHFALDKIKYLGFFISANGISIDPKNVEVIEKMSMPKTISELRSFLGACSYFRKFVQNFSIIMSPLYNLTKEGKFLKPENWEKECLNAFKNIKSKLKTAPVLASPQIGKSFIIETDASMHGLAATLLQKGHDDKEHPILYFSQVLKPHQKKYHVNELKALAVVMALRTFRPYIEGSGKTLIRSDNSVLNTKFLNINH